MITQKCITQKWFSKIIFGISFEVIQISDQIFGSLKVNYENLSLIFIRIGSFGRPLSALATVYNLGTFPLKDTVLLRERSHCGILPGDYHFLTIENIQIYRMENIFAQWAEMSPVRLLTPTLFCEDNNGPPFFHILGNIQLLWIVISFTPS